MGAVPLHARAGVLIDLNDKVCFSTKHLQKHKKVVPRGAILANEMGLGYFIYIYLNLVKIVKFVLEKQLRLSA